MKRLMVTGSRTWTDEYLMAAVLRSAYVRLGGHKDRITLVHGDAHDGADRMAEKVWRGAEQALVEPHPADWSQGKGAGFARNYEMAQSGIDLCLAFVKECRDDACVRYKNGNNHWTHGTEHAVLAARGEGVPVWLIGEWS